MSGKSETTQLSTQQNVIQRAGTKPNQPSTDGKFRIKLSSDREKFSYDNRAELGINEVLPQHYQILRYDVNDQNQVISVWTEEHGKTTLAKPIEKPSNGKRLLMIDTVGHEDTGQNDQQGGADKLFIDIKIGHYTKSGQQFRIEGGSWKRPFKWLEHNLKDMKRTSRKDGYDIDANNLNSFNARYAQAEKIPNDPLKKALFAAASPLIDINTKISQAPVTFVGASVFVVLNLTRPENSTAKLIDPDHPIVLKEPQDMNALVPDDVMIKGKLEKNRDWNEYSKKWNEGFDNGFKNFLSWYEKKFHALPGEVPRL